MRDEKEVSKEEELEEAKAMQKDREAGMVIEDISRKHGCSETTVRRRLDLWDEHVGKETAEKKETKTAATILQTVYGIIGSDKMAEQIGEITGANVATIEGIIRRIREGKATKAEVSKLLANVTGAVSGYFSGKELFSSVAKRLPTRVPMNEEEFKRMAEKAAEKKFEELTVAAEKKKKKQEAKAS